MTGVVLVPLLLASLSVAAVAPQVRVVRYGDDRLTGISEVDVLVLSTNGSDCPAARTAVQTGAVRVLEAARIRATVSEKARSWPYSVVIRLQGARADGACVTSVVTELVAEVAGAPDADAALPPGTWGSLLMGFMPLLHAEALVITPALEHDAAVQQTVREHVTQIASTVRSINK